MQIHKTSRLNKTANIVVKSDKFHIHFIDDSHSSKTAKKLEEDSTHTSAKTRAGSV